MSSMLKIRKRSMLPIDKLEALRGEPDLGIFKIRHRMNPALHPRYLSNLTLGLVNHFNELINHYHPDLEGILAGFGKIFLHRPNGHFLNEEAHIHLDVTADFWVFRPSVGAQLRGVVNKKSASHVSVLVHGCFNVPCHLPPGIQSSEWCGTKSRIGQIVRFTVTKTDMSQKIPYIQGNLLSNSVDEGKMANQNILFDNRVADLTSEEFDRVQQTSEYEDSGIEKTKKKRKRDVAFINDVTPPKKKKKKTDVEREVSETHKWLEGSSLKKKKKKKLNMETEESATTDDEDLTERMLEAIKDMEGLRKDKEEACKGKKKKKKSKGKDEISLEVNSSPKKKKKSRKDDDPPSARHNTEFLSFPVYRSAAPASINEKNLEAENRVNHSDSELQTSVSLQKETGRVNKSSNTSKGAGQVASTNVKTDETYKKPRKVPPYALFMQENRKKIQLEHPDMSFAEISKKMGEMWRSLSNEDKENYFTKAKFVNEEKLQEWNLKNPGAPESKSSKKKVEQISAYSIFVEETRPNLTKSYPSLDVTDTNRMIDDLWKNERKHENKKRVEDANEVEVRNSLTTEHKDVAKKKPGKTSSYLMFFQEKRPIMVAKFPNLKFAEISKLAGDLWKDLTEVEKDEYKRKADVVNGEKLQRWAMENSTNQLSPVVKKAATPREQKRKEKTGTPSGELSRLAHQSQG